MFDTRGPSAPWAPEQFRTAAPVGYKPCTTCDGHLLSHDAHVRCQKCRNAGGYIKPNKAHGRRYR